MTTIHRSAHLFTGKTDNGFVCARVETDRDRFSITGHVYSSEEAYNLGIGSAIHSAGQITDDIVAAIPELASFMHLHMQPLDAPGTDDGFDTKYAVKNSGADFLDFLVKNPPSVEPCDESTEEFEHTFDNGVAVGAEIDEPEWAVSTMVPGSYCTQYKVTVTVDDDSTVLRSWGSVNDYDNGHFDARGAAWGVLSDLYTWHNEGDEFFEQIEGIKVMSAEQAHNLSATLKFAEQHGDKIEVIYYTIGL